MAHYAPCQNCANDANQCHRRHEIKSAIKGLYVTSLKFKCDMRKPLFRRGQRVVVEFPISDEFEYCEDRWPATVIAEKGSRFLCKVDNAPSYECEMKAEHYFKNESLFVRVPAHRINVLSEPDLRVCEHCDAPDGQTEGSCYHRTWLGHEQNTCLAALTSIGDNDA